MIVAAAAIYLPLRRARQTSQIRCTDAPQNGKPVLLAGQVWLRAVRDRCLNDLRDLKFYKYYL